jgi:hypothetical protein
LDADRARHHRCLDSHFVVVTPLGRLSWRGAGGAIERNSQFDVGSHGQVFPRTYRNSRCHVNRGIRLCRLHTIGASIGCVFRDMRLAAK